MKIAFLFLGLVLGSKDTELPNVSLRFQFQLEPLTEDQSLINDIAMGIQQAKGEIDLKHVPDSQKEIKYLQISLGPDPSDSMYGLKGVDQSGETFFVFDSNLDMDLVYESPLYFSKSEPMEMDFHPPGDLSTKWQLDHYRIQILGDPNRRLGWRFMSYGRGTIQNGTSMKPFGVVILSREKGILVLDSDDDGIFDHLLNRLEPLTVAGENYKHYLDMERGILTIIPTNLEPVVKGSKAPGIRLNHSSKKEEFDLGQERGRVVLLVFGSPFCGACVRNLPDVVKLAKTNFQQSFKLFYIVESEKAAKLVKDKAPELNILVGKQAWTDYQVQGTPVFFIVDSNGVIALRDDGSQALRNGTLKMTLSALTKK